MMPRFRWGDSAQLESARRSPRAVQRYLWNVASELSQLPQDGTWFTANKGPVLGNTMKYTCSVSNSSVWSAL